MRHSDARFVSPTIKTPRFLRTVRREFTEYTAQGSDCDRTFKNGSLRSLRGMRAYHLRSWLGVCG